MPENDGDSGSAATILAAAAALSPGGGSSKKLKQARLPFAPLNKTPQPGKN